MGRINFRRELSRTPYRLSRAEDIDTADLTLSAELIKHVVSLCRLVALRRRFTTPNRAYTKSTGDTIRRPVRAADENERNTANQFSLQRCS